MLLNEPGGYLLFAAFLAVVLIGMKRSLKAAPKGFPLPNADAHMGYVVAYVGVRLFFVFSLGMAIAVSLNKNQ